MDLLQLLERELREIGLPEVRMDEYGYVFATIPSTTHKTDVPVIGFIAHVDTSPEMSGADVRPIVHRNYQGQDLVLPDDPEMVLRMSDNPWLAEQIGNDIVTASGATPLGADNKAGVAEIVAAAEYLMAHPDIPHGTIRIAFTPDEEVGAGTKFFDVQRFGAVYAYTMDGETRGEIETESFSAHAISLTFRGFNTHPDGGNGQRDHVVADQPVARRELSPEHRRRSGRVHPYVLQVAVDSTAVKPRARFQRPLRQRVWLEIWPVEPQDWPGASLDTSIGDLPEHEGNPRCSSARGRLRARGHTPQRVDRQGASHSRRNRWLSPVIHGVAYAEYLCRRAQFSFAARMGLGAG